MVPDRKLFKGRSVLTQRIKTVQGEQAAADAGTTTAAQEANQRRLQLDIQRRDPASRLNQAHFTQASVMSSLRTDRDLPLLPSSRRLMGVLREHKP